MGVEEREADLSEESIDALEGDGVPGLREEGRVRGCETSEGVETIVVVELEEEVAKDLLEDFDGEDGESGSS